jgi:hypothetical protein
MSFFPPNSLYSTRSFGKAATVSEFGQGEQIRPIKSVMTSKVNAIHRNKGISNPAEEKAMKVLKFCISESRLGEQFRPVNSIMISKYMEKAPHWHLW